VTALPSRESHYLLNERLGWTHGYSGHFEEQKNLTPLQGVETYIVQPVDCSVHLWYCPGYPAYVFLPTALSKTLWLHFTSYKKHRKLNRL